MTDDDIAKARDLIARAGAPIWAQPSWRQTLDGWSSALDEVERLRKPIDDTPPDAPSTASTVKYARKYLASDSGGAPTLDEFQASCFAMVLVRVSAARSHLADEVERLTKLHAEKHAQNERMCAEIERLDGEVAKLTADCHRWQVLGRGKPLANSKKHAGKAVTLREGDATWHDGPGWYYMIDDYPDEGSCGAFASRLLAEQHARIAGFLVEPLEAGA